MLWHPLLCNTFHYFASLSTRMNQISVHYNFYFIWTKVFITSTYYSNQLCGGIVVLVVCGGGIVGLGTLISYIELNYFVTLNNDCGVVN